MYYEEKIINGVVHYRGAPDDKWTPYTILELSERYMRMVTELNRYYAATELAHIGEVNHDS